MLTIRKETFETNSSSCHSITLGNFNYSDTDISLDFKGDDFNWEWVKYDTPQSKLSYWISAYSSYVALLQKKALAKVLGFEQEYYSAWVTDDKKYWGERSGKLPFEVWKPIADEVASHYKDVINTFESHFVQLNFNTEYQYGSYEIDKYETFDLLDEMASESKYEHDSSICPPFDTGCIDHQSSAIESSECEDLAKLSPEEVYGFVMGDGYVQCGNDNDYPSDYE